MQASSSEEFRKFLILIDEAVPKDLAVHVVLDNLSTHKTPAVKRWFARNPRFAVHFTPTYSSWLNQVERGGTLAQPGTDPHLATIGRSSPKPFRAVERRVLPCGRCDARALCSRAQTGGDRCRR
jgi:hypothetical protein